jgi:hypothetical protein
MKHVFFWGLGLAVVAFIIAAVNTDTSPAGVAERIQRQCDREYGAMTDGASRCKLRAISEAYHRMESDRYDRATSGIRR